LIDHLVVTHASLLSLQLIEPPTFPA
jgi:hypothetical protein